MSNRLAELQHRLELKNGPGLKPRPPKAVRRSATALALSRAQGGPVDYVVPGTVPVLKQPDSMACWATVTAMMMSWRRQQSISIDDAVASVGPEYVKILRSNAGLSSDEKPVFLATAGFVAEFPQSQSMEGWEEMLRRYGPLWVTTDETPRFAIHARIMTGIRGDGTPEGTTVDIIDPGTGTSYSEPFTTFVTKFEKETAQTGNLRIQIVHWPPDAGLGIAKSQAAARSLALQLSTGLLSDEELEEGEPDVAELDPDRRPRATALTVVAFSKPAMDGDDVRWPPDALSPDYRHLGQPGLSVYFPVDGALLGRLARLNHFDVSGGQDQVVFGLRGCAVEANKPRFAGSVRVTETEPNHFDNMCVIGVWKRSTGEVACFQASTVPNWKMMEAYRQGGRRSNMLPTGRYSFRVGTHRPTKTDEQGNKVTNPHRIQGSLLEAEERVVLRTPDDLTYTVKDQWDRGRVGDNIHASAANIHADKKPDFASAGCQTVPGKSKGDTPAGAWADFRTALGLNNAQPTADDGKRFVYMLLTGRDARLASSGAADPSLTRLRFGSRGPAVAALQRGLKAAGQNPGPADGALGPGTMMAYIRWQQSRDGGSADGIVTPDSARLLGGDLSVQSSVISRAGTRGGAAVAHAFDREIPLSPSTGGRSIGPDALEVGDIILSTTRDPVSVGIRIASEAPVSHAMLYIGDGQVVEAIGSGVVLRQLDQAIADSTLAVAVRKPGLTAEQGLRIRDFAGRQLDKKYDYWGIVRQAKFRIDDLRYCRLLPEPLRSKCRQFVGWINLGTSTNDSFFCSELILAAYADAGAPLTVTPPHWTTPGEVADLQLSGKLNYVGHLKAEP